MFSAASLHRMKLSILHLKVLVKNSSFFACYTEIEAYAIIIFSTQEI